MSAREEDEDLMIACRDFRKLADSCSRTGFVEGVEVGKDEGLKDGFTAGFASGVALSTPWAILKGRTSALKLFCRRQPQHSHVSKQLEELLKDIQNSEKAKEEAAMSERKKYERITTGMVDSTLSQTKDVPRSSAECCSGLIRTEEETAVATSVADTDNCYGRMLGDVKPSTVSIDEFGSRLDAIKKSLL